MPSPRITGQFIYPSSPTPVWGHNKIMDSITLLSAAGKVAADAYFENKIHYSPASSYAEATARQVGCLFIFDREKRRKNAKVRLGLLLHFKPRILRIVRIFLGLLIQFCTTEKHGIHGRAWVAEGRRICEAACLEVPVPSSVGYSTKEKTPRPGDGNGVGRMVGFPMPGYLRRRRMSASPPRPRKAVVDGSGSTSPS